MSRLASVLVLLGVIACNGQPAEQASGTRSELPMLDDESPEIDIGPVIAEVNGVKIGANEFSAAALRSQASKDGELTLEERQAILSDLIDQKALYLEARRLGLDQDPKVQTQMIQLLLRRSVYSAVRSNDFTDEDLRSYFEEHQDEFVVPEKVRTRRIFVKGDPVRSKDEAKAMIDAAHAQVTADPESFAKVATESSEGPYRGRGGDMGLLSDQGRPGIPPEVLDQAFALDTGGISEPFFAGGGWNVVQVVFKREPVERTFEQMKGAVLRRVKSQRQRELYEETVKRLRDGAKVEIDEQALTSVELRRGPRVKPRGPGFLRGGDRATPPPRIERDGGAEEPDDEESGGAGDLDGEDE